jgi:Uma2 family endonuclease
MTKIHFGDPDAPQFVSAFGATHQVVSLRLAAALLHYVEPGNLGKILQSPFPVVLSKEIVVRPDILFIKSSRIGLMRENSMQGPPDLIIEVTAPTTRECDRIFKRNLYSRFEVKEYWVVDPQSQKIEILLWSELGYASNGIFRKSGRLASPALPGFRLPAYRIFRNCSPQKPPRQISLSCL